MPKQVTSKHCYDNDTCICIGNCLQVSAVQVAPSKLSIDLHAASSHLELKADLQITGVYVSIDHILIWNGKRMVVYEISADSNRMRVVGKWQF